MCLGELFGINKIVKSSNSLLIWSNCALFYFFHPSVYSCQLGYSRWLLHKIPTLSELGKQYPNFPSSVPEVKGRSG